MKNLKLKLLLLLLFLLDFRTYIRLVITNTFKALFNNDMG